MFKIQAANGKIEKLKKLLKKTIVVHNCKGYFSKNMQRSMYSGTQRKVQQMSNESMMIEFSSRRHIVPIVWHKTKLNSLTVLNCLEVHYAKGPNIKCDAMHKNTVKQQHFVIVCNDLKCCSL